MLLHGLMMDASLWDSPIADLAADHRCVAPTLPRRAHRHAIRLEADLSLPGIAQLVAEFTDHLDLHDVTLIRNDTGGALIQLVMRDGAGRVSRVVPRKQPAAAHYLPSRFPGQFSVRPGSVEVNGDEAPPHAQGHP